MGDFNARHLSWGDRVISKNGERLAKDLDLTKFSIVSPPTPSFLCINGNSFIDLFIVSSNLSNSVSRCWTDESAILFSGAPIRGHLPVHIKLTCKESLHNKTHIQVKTDLSKVDWEKWQNDLEDTLDMRYNNILNQSQDPNEYWDALKKCFEEVTNRNATKKKICKHSKPYWTSELSLLAKKYHAALRCWNKRNTDINKYKLETAKDTFDNARKEECRKFVLNSTKGLNSAETRVFC